MQGCKELQMWYGMTSKAYMCGGVKVLQDVGLWSVSVERVSKYVFGGVVMAYG